VHRIISGDGEVLQEDGEWGSVDSPYSLPSQMRALWIANRLEFRQAGSGDHEASQSENDMVDSEEVRRGRVAR